MDIKLESRTYSSNQIFTDPCSMTSWMAVRSMSDILSNSSIQTTPRSAKTMAPASKRRSPDSGSVVTAAVKPTPDEPRPLKEKQFDKDLDRYDGKTVKQPV